MLSDGAVKLGVITDAGIPTPHLQQSLSGLDALVLECNYDHDMLWAGAYPRWLKERIGGPFGHLDNRDSERLLAGLDRSKLKHVIGAHLSQQNNKPALARAALARAMGCAEDWIGIADKDDGFAWRSIYSGQAAFVCTYVQHELRLTPNTVTVVLETDGYDAAQISPKRPRSAWPSFSSPRPIAPRKMDATGRRT